MIEPLEPLLRPCFMFVQHEKLRFLAADFPTVYDDKKLIERRLERGWINTVSIETIGIDNFVCYFVIIDSLCENFISAHLPFFIGFVPSGYRGDLSLSNC